PSGGGIIKGGGGGPHHNKWFVSLGAGTGGGYVSGKTEQARENVKCCFAPALLHVLPEFGYQMSPSSTLSLAVRIGFPVGADLPGHATAAPAALLRYRKTLKPTGEGLAWSAALGGGLLRNTVPLSVMGTDTAVSGPLLVGGGLGYLKGKGSTKLVAELNTIAGIPIVSDMGGDPPVVPHFGLEFDLNLALVFGF
ncbi:MAG TPA: hypothetical protein VL172_20610, partial [Kofleriaceae bacterium]|nr:hypothetical protein [Kofleriaceae bacterium]